MYWSHNEVTLLMSYTKNTIRLPVIHMQPVARQLAIRQILDITVAMDVVTTEILNQVSDIEILQARQLEQHIAMVN